MMQAYHVGNTVTTGSVVNTDFLLPAGKVLVAIAMSIAGQINPATTGVHFGYFAILQGGLFDTGTVGKSNVLAHIFISGYRIAAGDPNFVSSDNLYMGNLRIPLSGRPSLRMSSTAGLWSVVVCECTLFVE